MIGQTTFMIGPPWFKSLAIRLGDDRNLAVISTGRDSDSAHSVQSLKVNGKSWSIAWTTLDDIFATRHRLRFRAGAVGDW